MLSTLFKKFFLLQFDRNVGRVQSRCPVVQERAGQDGGIGIGTEERQQPDSVYWSSSDSRLPPAPTVAQAIRNPGTTYQEQDPTERGRADIDKPLARPLPGHPAATHRTGQGGIVPV